MDTEFTVTEDAMRAVLTTMTNMNAAVTVLSRSADAANEAITIMAHRLDHLEAEINRLQPV
jgi:hypothetical protein